MIGPLLQADRVYGWDPSWWPGSNGRSSISLTLLFYFVGALAVFLAGRMAWIYWKRFYKWSEPLRIYWRLAAQMGLAGDQRILLWRIARAGQLPSPLALMFSAGTLDEHARAFGRKLPASAIAKFEKRIDAIEARLFNA
ncbi:MAG: hypothetical protein GC162_05515 [Planctomycetes bacterium]|nr:hypothetical protein [Planctomycetota bacterium]